MLVLSRKLGEKIVLINPITKTVIASITLVDVDRNKVRLGIEADKTTVGVFREEILPSEYIPLST